VAVTTNFFVNDLHSSAAETASTTAATAGTWSHIVFTNATNVQQVFVNGVLEASGTGTNSAPTAANLLLGWRTGGTEAEHFDGVLEDFRIYNRVLTANEILTIATSHGADSIIDGLVHRWMMNDGYSGAEVTGASTVRDIVDAAQLHGTGTATPFYREDFRTRWRRRRSCS
jgi:hypothetical protein